MLKASICFCLALFFLLALSASLTQIAPAAATGFFHQLKKEGKEKAAPFSRSKTFSKTLKGVNICPCETVPVVGPPSNCAKGFDPSKHHHNCFPAQNWQATVLSYNARAPPVADDAPHQITMMWFTGDLLDVNFYNWSVRVYVDGEKDASISFTFAESHSLPYGFDGADKIDDDLNTFSTKYLGKGSLNGGLSLFYPIPFTKSIEVTVSMALADREFPTAHSLYSIIHGLENAPLRLRGESLPSSARLRTTLTAGIQQPHTVVQLANISNKSGLIFSLNYLASSPLPHFLEGRTYAFIDGQDKLTIAEGIEDFFLSAQYFSSCVTNLRGGCTHRSISCIDSFGYFLASRLKEKVLTYAHKDQGLSKGCQVGAYRHFDQDPIVFADSCVFSMQIGDPSWKVTPTNLRVLLWHYEW